MSTTVGSPSANLEFDSRAHEYAQHRKVHSGVVEALIGSGLLGPASRVLDVGCGTGNYAAVLTAATHCRIFGIDPSLKMLDRARDAAHGNPWRKAARKSCPLTRIHLTWS